MGLREDMGSWVLAAVPDGLWVLDADGTTVWANAAMADLLGVPHDEVVGYSAFDALDDDGREGLREHLATLARSREPGADLDCLLLRPDGSSVWTQASHVPLVDAAGEHRGWLHRVRDHSEEQRLLDELRSREVRLAEAQAIARVGSWEREASDPLPTWSAELYRVFEVDPETFVPSTVSFIEKIHPDDRPGAVAAYEAMMAGGDPIDVDARLLRAPGLPTRWVRTRGYATFDDEGRMLRVSGTVQDITESKEAEQGLAFLSAMAGAANEAETLEEALLAADAVVRPFTQWPALLVSFPDPDGSGRLWHVDTRWEEVGPDKLAASERLAARAAAERRVVQEVGPAGNYLVSGPAVAGDRIACVVTSTSRATTPPRPAEVAIFTQMLALLASVSQREQAGNELASARDDALAASRAKSEFLATMSHEIRTPLNGVIGLSELLGRTELTPHQRRLAQGVDQAGRTLLSLVNDILDLSKIEAGRLDLEEVDFDPRLVLEQSVGLVAERASGKQVELVVSTGSGMPSMVRGDPVRFGQVVTNLVSNAVKFTHQGEVVVRADGEGDTVRVEVRDTGIGIEPEVRDRLFRAFSQADSSTTREYGGTGLGLAISKRIVEAVGGEIGVESQVGVGSTFWFTAPFAPAVATNPPSEAALREAVTGLRVLVVDDNATNRFIMTEQLQAWGVHVVAVDSAYDALVELDAAARRAAPYDVALLDYMMPGADGEQLARIIRSEERHRGLRLALLSSALEGDPEWLADAGIESFLSKPVLPSRLLDLLATLGGRLDPAQVAAPAVPRPQPGVVRGRLLVAEDNPINQMVAEGVLRRLGYDLLIVENGAAAVAALADDPDGFDAILMDCQMPVMDGFDATRAVRAMRGDGGRIPIIAMTAATTAEERERCLEAGMDDFLSKPVVPDLIEAALDRWVKPAAIAPAAPTRGVRREEGSRLVQLVEDEGIDRELVLRMVDRFTVSATGSVAEVREAATDGDAEQVARLTHSLRGSAANLGLGDLAAASAAMEEDARHGRLPEAPALTALEQAAAEGVLRLVADAQALRTS